jgi:hypothetical protein
MSDRAAMLAAGVLVLALAMPALAQSGRSIGWSPSRDEAVILDEDAIGSGVVPAQVLAEELPGPSLRVQRPARLMPRGAVSRTPEPSVAMEDLAVPPGTMVEQAMPMQEGDCADCAGDGCVNCCGNWNSCGPVSPCLLIPRPRLDPLEVLLGVQGFTGPANRGAGGSFGFYQGFNHALPLCNDFICAQLGARWTESNFDGSLLTSDQRNQIFLTAGFFRRVDWGLQGGVVFDYLHDEWDYEVDLGQVRGELGWRFACVNEIGFRFSVGTAGNDGILSEIIENDGEFEIRERQARFEVNDLFAFYYRRQFACGGEGRLFGGFTNCNQGLFGGDARLPINPCWSLQADFLYVVPSDERELRGFADESWNVSVGVVWTPFARPGCPVYCRPLLDVANNGTFVTKIDEGNPVVTPQ